MRLARLGLATLVVTLAVLGAAAAAPGAANERLAVIVAFRQPPTAADLAFVREAGGDVAHVYRIVPALAARVPTSALEGLARNPRVASIEADGTVEALDYDGDDWGITQIKADQPHAKGLTGTGVRVAIVDTGVSCQHLELDSNCYAGSDDWDFVNDDGDPDDDNGHGTHVAGTVAAERNAGVATGVVGVAPTATVVGYKVLDSGGSGPWSNVIAAIDRVWNNGAKRAEVVNMSLGGSSAPDTMREAMERAYASGILLVAAAGNGGNCGGKGNSVSYPARYASVVAVAAVDTNNQRPCFSSTGEEVELAAPGVSVFSTWPEDKSTSAHNPQPVCDGGVCHYKYGSGTSMASPHVAGAAALLLASGSLNDSSGMNGLADEARQRLAETAVDLGATGRDPQFGYGLIDAAAATMAPNAAPSVSITSPADDAIFDSGATIDFQGSASDAEDGDLTSSLTWTSSIDGAIGNGGSFIRSLSDGIHTITASVTDADGQTTATSITITVGSAPPPASTVSVASIAYATEGGKQQNLHLLVTVALIDGAGKPVSGASVAIRLDRDGALYRTAGGTTGTDGEVTFKATNAPSGCYTTTVTSVTASGLGWDGATPANQFCK